MLKGFLCEIFRVSGIVDVEAAVLKDLRIIFAYEAFNGGVVAAFHSLYEQQIQIHAAPPFRVWPALKSEREPSV